MWRIVPGAALAGLLSTVHASDGGARIVIGVESATSVTDVARYRLTEYLLDHGCRADLRFNTEIGDFALAFLSGIPAGRPPILEAVNRNGQLPVPVWVTRRTAGVRHIRDLQGRDLATVADRDLLGASLPLAELKKQGFIPAAEQLYEAGDYSSALGLLLHNNTHASVSELGFVRPFLDGNNLVVSWQGKPVAAAAWYRQAAWSQAALACEQALLRLQREDDSQIFVIFPEWVFGFALPERQYSEDSMQ
ncbi:PhnD/SsuA/transferrin family substrate-binding protein [Marinobacter sp. PE14]